MECLVSLTHTPHADTKTRAHTCTPHNTLDNDDAGIFPLVSSSPDGPFENQKQIFCKHAITQDTYTAVHNRGMRGKKKQQYEVNTVFYRLINGKDPAPPNPDAPLRCVHIKTPGPRKTNSRYCSIVVGEALL